MPWVIDASVAFKWFVPEVDDDKALALLDGNEALVAPDLIFAEVANGMWARLRSIDGGQAATSAAQRALREVLTSTYPSHAFVDRAVEIAFELRHPVYDCVYLALCEREGMQMVIADQRLTDQVRGTRFEALLVLL